MKRIVTILGIVIIIATSFFGVFAIAKKGDVGDEPFGQEKKKKKEKKEKKEKPEKGNADDPARYEAVEVGGEEKVKKDKDKEKGKSNDLPVFSAVSRGGKKDNDFDGEKNKSNDPKKEGATDFGGNL